MAAEGDLFVSTVLHGIECKRRIIGSIAIYRFILNTNKPNLVVLPDFSNESFQNTSLNVLYRIQYLEKKYSQIYIFNFSHSNINIKEKYLKCGDIKITFLDMCANSINYVLKNVLAVSNIHILGVGCGSGIAINLIIKDKLYRNLFLANPSHPTNITSLTKHNLSNMSIRIQWIYPDDTKTDYDDTIELIQNKHKINITSKYYDMSVGKEVHPDFVFDICQGK